MAVLCHPAPWPCPKAKAPHNPSIRKASAHARVSRDRLVLLPCFPQNAGNAESPSWAVPTACLQLPVSSNRASFGNSTQGTDSMLRNVQWEKVLVWTNTEMQMSEPCHGQSRVSASGHGATPSHPVHSHLPRPALGQCLRQGSHSVLGAMLGLREGFRFFQASMFPHW